MNVHSNTLTLVALDFTASTRGAVPGPVNVDSDRPHDPGESTTGGKEPS
jgi:hypothetical protein